MAENYIKVTCKLPRNIIHKYFNMPSQNLHVFRREMELIFKEHSIPEFPMRIYWIDSEQDEIDLISQVDYDFFLSMNGQGNRHIYVARIIESSAAANGDDNDKVHDNDGVHNNENVHDIVCDSCELHPIVGFRYKCIQCPDYDLCQRCEAKHKHPEHIMLRLPNKGCTKVVRTWITDGNKRPFVFGRAAADNDVNADKGNASGAAADNDVNTGKDNGSGAESANAGFEGTRRHSHGHGHRHGRKYNKRVMRNGFFANLYGIIQDMADVSATTSTGKEKTPEKEEEQAKEEQTSATDEKVYLNDVAAAVAAAAHSAATIAATAAVNAASAAVNAASATAKAANNVAASQVATNAAAAAATAAAEQIAKNFKEQTSEATAAKPAQEKTNTNTVYSEQQNNTEANIDNLAHMRAGIEILSNFSEMFDKILNPTHYGASTTTDDNVPLNSRKGSASGTNATNNSSQTSIESKDSETQIPPAVYLNNKANYVGPTADADASITSAKSRVDSVDNDWQMIDSQTNVEPLSKNSSELNSTELINKNSARDVNKTDAAAALSYPNLTEVTKLSEQLQQHLEKEQTQQDNVVNAESQNAQESVVSTSSASQIEANSMTTQEAHEVLIYHTDEVINNAVHAMMAMGFSNKGGWLTQLLSSVNGNIPAALDAMSAAQYSDRD